MWTLKNLMSWGVTAEIDKEWVPARPLIQPLKWRVKDAWKVLTGKADAFTWPKGQ